VKTMGSFLGVKIRIDYSKRDRKGIRFNEARDELEMRKMAK